MPLVAGVAGVIVVVLVRGWSRRRALGRRDRVGRLSTRARAPPRRGARALRRRERQRSLPVRSSPGSSRSSRRTCSRSSGIFGGLRGRRRRSRPAGHARRVVVRVSLRPRVHDLVRRARRRPRARRRAALQRPVPARESRVRPRRFRPRTHGAPALARSARRSRPAQGARTGGRGCCSGAFAICAAPCIGPVLTGILVLARLVRHGGRRQAAARCDSLGLPFPFVLVGAIFTRAMGAFRWLRTTRAIQIVGGAIMVALGLLLFFERFYVLRVCPEPLPPVARDRARVLDVDVSELELSAASSAAVTWASTAATSTPPV